MRGDSESRHKGYAIGRQWGYMSANDILELEDRNPIAGGDVYLVPLNMVPADQAGRLLTDGGRFLANGDEKRLLPEATETRALETLVRLKRAHAPVFEDAARRLLKREADTIERQFRRQAERSLADFLEWLRQFYEGFGATAAQAMTPALMSYGAAVATEAAQQVDAEPPEMDQFVSSYAGAYAARHTRDSQQAIEAIVADSPPQELPERLGNTLQAWRTERPAQVARDETEQAANAFARFAWVAAGVKKLRWIVVGPSCPLCEELNGRVVGIQLGFLAAGDVVTGGGKRISAGKTLHPPLHKGCDCMILPA